MAQTPEQEAERNFHRKQDVEQRRYYARNHKPKRMAGVLGQLITQRGYGRLETDNRLREAWNHAAGETASRYSNPGRIRRGQLEVIVASSSWLQELTFQKVQILQQLQQQLPDAGIRSVRFRIGQVS